ncbi:hypothetical protein DEA8626_03377 [Defluviimonas aquaemixtae]|uniref:Internalin-A n=1 Tax=Albidovulum aquaemixtae TaxID=1542388 RepID=A0A2R8BLT9_9RHOB|nr:leucine-rich repeat domain-containing protein [Defluviimonas aquaemixtae]SPH24326.1 hypothetical protein DEA8626_03377 [Defluviimonas aquaemixtae]
MGNPLDDLQYAVMTDGRWRDGRFPKVFLDGHELDLAACKGPIEGERALILGAHGKNLHDLLARVTVDTLGICDSRAEDFSGLARLSGLRRLDIRYVTRLTDISCLRGLKHLETLVFYEPGKLTDISPIAALENLTAFEFSGGISAVARADSLAPIGALKRLEMLRLLNLRVTDGGLRPLAGCESLACLDVSNQFETADYAYLSVMLPDTECALFRPYTDLECKIGDSDVMVTGLRKPFLNAKRDAARLARYVEAFELLRAEARAGR